MTTSFDERHFSRKREKLLLQWADIATFVSRDHLLQVQRDLGSRRASTRFEVLRPPPLALAERQPLSYDLEKLVLKLGNFVLWPEPPKKPELINEFLAAGWGSLQRSPRFDSRSPGFFSGAISAGEWQSLAARSGALVTAGLSLHANQLIEIQTLANHHQIPLIVDPSQSRRVPGLVREGSTGWTVHSAQSLRDLMEKNSRLQCEGPFSESISREMDLVVNELMRCYRSQP